MSKPLKKLPALFWAALWKWNELQAQAELCRAGTLDSHDKPALHNDGVGAGAGLLYIGMVNYHPHCVLRQKLEVSRLDSRNGCLKILKTYLKWTEKNPSIPYNNKYKLYTSAGKKASSLNVNFML